MTVFNLRDGMNFTAIGRDVERAEQGDPFAGRRLRLAATTRPIRHRRFASPPGQCAKPAPTVEGASGPGARVRPPRRARRTDKHNHDHQLTL
jgi:hypothetical protein